MSTLLASAPALTPEECSYLAEVVACRLDRQIRNLQVEFLPSGIVLEGVAPCYYTRTWAEEQAENLTGRPVLCNNIRVC